MSGHWRCHASAVATRAPGTGCCTRSPIPSAAWKQEKISRDTLLVNWWREAPKPPNCARFTVGRWQRLGLRVKLASALVLGVDGGGGLGLRVGGSGPWNSRCIVHALWLRFHPLVLILLWSMRAPCAHILRRRFN